MISSSRISGNTSKADGTYIDVAVYSKAFTYDGRNARLTVIHDITKTKIAEGELRRTKIFLNAVIEHVPLPIVVRDLDGSGTTRAETDLRYSTAPTKN